MPKKSRILSVSVLGWVMSAVIGTGAEAAKISVWGCSGKTVSASVSALIVPGAKAQHVLTIRNAATREIIDEVRVKPVSLSRDSQQIFAAIYTGADAAGAGRRQFTLEIKNVVLASGLSSALVIDGRGKKVTRQLQCVGSR
jgi:hypothetical protein